MSAASQQRRSDARRAAPELLTRRLRLRPWRRADEVVMAQINADPEVTRHLSRPRTPVPATAFYEIVTAHWEAHGFGFWAAEARTGERAGDLLGFIGLGYPTFIPVLATRVEIGWRLARHAWGRGLATEGATAVRDHAVGDLQLPELISIIHPENARSQRVAAKLGMTPTERVVHPMSGTEVDVWTLTRPSAAQSQAPGAAARGGAGAAPPRRARTAPR
ncbi:MAG TPA: GNAT family N-acetyltransferase [Solirubrobacteraceae bacterium]|nr:GNAT family N-acetyltransferase [Solirubrobacteraceae bacterium]